MPNVLRSLHFVLLPLLIASGLHAQAGNLDTVPCHRELRFGGKTTIALNAGGQSFETPTDVLLQPDGKIVVTGDLQTGSDNLNFGAARLTAGDVLDTLFGNGGKTVIPFDQGGEKADYLSGMAMQLDGYIVRVGFVERASAGDYDWAVTRVVGDPFFGF